MTFNRLALDIVECCNKYVAEGGQIVAHTWRSRDGRRGSPLAVWGTGGVCPIPPPESFGYLMGSSDVVLDRLWDTGLFTSRNEAEVFVREFTHMVDGEHLRNPYINCANNVIRLLGATML